MPHTDTIERPADQVEPTGTGPRLSTGWRWVRLHWIPIGAMAAAVLLFVVGGIWLAAASDLRKQTGDLESEASRSEAAIAATATRIAETRAEIDGLEAEIAAAVADLSRANDDLVALHAQFEVLDGATRPGAVEILEVESDVIAVSDQLGAANAILNTITRRFDNAIERGNLRQIDSMREALGRAEDDLDALRAALEILEGQVLALGNAVETMTNGEEDR